MERATKRALDRRKRLIHGRRRMTFDASWCGYQRLPNFSSMSSGEVITTVHIQGNNICSFNGLSRLDTLRDLDCEHNNLTSFDGLSSLTQLEYLSCGHNPIVDTAKLTLLTGLKTLSIRQCKLTSLTGLGSLTRLTRLVCSRNFDLRSIDGLGHITSLQELYINSTSIGWLDRLDDHQYLCLVQACTTGLPSHLDGHWRHEECIKFRSGISDMHEERRITQLTSAVLVIIQHKREIRHALGLVANAMRDVLKIKQEKKYR